MQDAGHSYDGEYHHDQLPFHAALHEIVTESRHSLCHSLSSFHGVECPPVYIHKPGGFCAVLLSSPITFIPQFKI